MCYVIGNFHYVPSSLYAYRCLSLPMRREGQDADGRSLHVTDKNERISRGEYTREKGGGKQ